MKLRGDGQSTTKSDSHENSPFSALFSPRLLAPGAAQARESIPANTHKVTLSALTLPSRPAARGAPPARATPTLLARPSALLTVARATQPHATMTAPVRVWAISDVHSDYADNEAWVRALASANKGFENDVIIVAGDVSDCSATLLRTMEDEMEGVEWRDRRERVGECSLIAHNLTAPPVAFTAAFSQVFFVPGNHDVWLRAAERDAPGAPPDSLAKWACLEQALNARGVRTCLGAWLAPPTQHAPPGSCPSSPGTRRGGTPSLMCLTPPPRVRSSQIFARAYGRRPWRPPTALATAGTRCMGFAQRRRHTGCSGGSCCVA